MSHPFTYFYTHTHCGPASFPYGLSKASVSAITGFYSWLTTLPLSSALYPRVMNYCPPAWSWVHLQKRHNPFLNTCFKGTSQFLPGESIKERVKNSSSISHCQKAEPKSHKAITRTHTQDEDVDCRQRGPAAKEGGNNDEGHFKYTALAFSAIPMPAHGPS